MSWSMTVVLSSRGIGGHGIRQQSSNWYRVVESVTCVAYIWRVTYNDFQTSGNRLVTSKEDMMARMLWSEVLATIKLTTRKKSSVIWSLTASLSTTLPKPNVANSPPANFGLLNLPTAHVFARTSKDGIINLFLGDGGRIPVLMTASTAW